MFLQRSRLGEVEIFSDSADLYKAKHPLIICTDDFGVFSTSLSNEYSLAVSSFGLGKRETFSLAKSAIDATFAEDEVKQQLRLIFDSASPEYV
ncbi:unnamed protein product [Eruca vesicaria subsp. sativa]|uniref:Adenosine deaminase domain-containing protein n=1 Tax=Eruca vesicaria subsp. sativa TaxID=29727 RepID=A0ABC8LEB7_ERUVS|nr:unnamed protein product [Eruca vesicaria subsp. sativa]